MERRLPLHIPQVLPLDWNTLLGPTEIPTEEQLSRPEYQDDDDFYNTHVCVGIDTKALVCATMHAFSAPLVPKIKYSRGGVCNVLFAISFPDGFKVVARIPRRQGRARGRTECTVAMMTMARCHQDIPLPEVYAWHPTSENAVGAPYILIEWVEGIEPWAQWYDLLGDIRSVLLDDLAAYHAKISRPLPFQGMMGSIYLAKHPVDAEVSFNDASAYRVGPIFPGPTCTKNRDRLVLPQTISESLHDFWKFLWQSEVDSITDLYGSDPSNVIHTNDDDEEEPLTIGRILKIAHSLLTLIQNCDLPSKPELYKPCIVTTDYAFRNIKMDPSSRKITSFLDWDDVYVAPFLLCSRYPEEICHVWGAGEAWHKTGGFYFMLLDVEGEVDMSRAIDASVRVESCEVVEPDSRSDDGNLQNDEAPEDEREEEEQGDTPENDGTTSQHTISMSNEDPQVCDDVSDPDPEHDPEEYDYPRRIMDTKLRRQYEHLLASHDERFGNDGLWEMRKLPLILQHLLMHGWKEWCIKEEWITDTAKQIKR